MRNKEKILDSLREVEGLLTAGITDEKKWYKIIVTDLNGARQEFIDREKRLESLMDIAINQIGEVMELLEVPSPTVAAVNESKKRIRGITIQLATHGTLPKEEENK